VLPRPKNKLYIVHEIINTMQNKLYKITSIFLLLLSLVSIIFLLLTYSFSPEDIGGSWQDAIAFTTRFFLPFYALPLILLSGIYYFIIGFQNKLTNKVIFASAIVQFISFPSLILAILLGLLPCLSGPPDGLCMLFGAPFMFLDFLLWIVGFIVLIIGIIIKKRRNRKF